MHITLSVYTLWIARARVKLGAPLIDYVLTLKSIFRGDTLKFNLHNNLSLSSFGLL